MSNNKSSNTTEEWHFPTDFRTLCYACKHKVSADAKPELGEILHILQVQIAQNAENALVWLLAILFTNQSNTQNSLTTEGEMENSSSVTDDDHYQ